MSALMLVAAACTAAPQPQREAPCPFTVPNGGPPPGNTGPANFGDGKLWVWVPGGKLYLAPDSDGRLSEKFGWWREVPGTLTIEGHRLDARAPWLNASVPDGYGPTGFQATGITFPTPGCWEITGHVGSESLTFVVEIARDFSPP